MQVCEDEGEEERRASVWGGGGRRKVWYASEATTWHIALHAYPQTDSAQKGDIRV